MYCVNCGVELDRSLRKCPLCNTPVWNPMENGQEKEKAAVSPFPEEKEAVEMIKRKYYVSAAQAKRCLAIL